MAGELTAGYAPADGVGVYWDALWDGSLAPASRLAIVPGMTHYNIGPSPQLATAVADFLR